MAGKTKHCKRLTHSAQRLVGINRGAASTKLSCIEIQKDKIV